MDISSLASLTFSIMLVAGAVVLFVASRKIYDESPGFFGTGSPIRVAIEAVLIILGITGPLLIIDGLLLLDLWPTWVKTIMPGASQLYTVLATSLSPSLIPMWLAIRMSPQKESQDRSFFLYYFQTAALFFLFVFLALLVSYVLVPIPILEFLGQTNIQLLDPRALIQAFVLAFWSVSLFLAARVIMALVGNPPELPARSRLGDIISITDRDETQYYNWIILGILLALLIWFSAASISLLDLDSAFFPVQLDLNKDLGLPVNPPQPTERMSLANLIILAASLFVLLVSLTISIFARPSEPATKVFVLLGLLYGLDGIDIFPLEFGSILYGITVLAKIFIIPAQMHFAMIFPRQALTQGSSEWRKRLPTVLYIVFTPLAILGVYLFLNQIQIAALEDQLRKAQASGQNDMEFLLLFLQVGFWALVSLLILAATAIGWIFNIVLLWRNYRNMREQQTRLSETLEEADEDVSLMDDFERRERLVAAVQQFRLAYWGILIGVMGFGAVLLLFLPFPIFNEGGWADVLFRLSRVAIFAFIAIAILEYRLWDVSRLFQRALIFTGLVILFSVILELVAGSVIERLFPAIQDLHPLLVDFFITIFVAVLAYMVEGPAERLVDRKFLSGILNFSQKAIEIKKSINSATRIQDVSYILTRLMPNNLAFSGAWAETPIKSNLSNAKRRLQGLGATSFFLLGTDKKLMGLYGIALKPSKAGLGNEEQYHLMGIGKTAGHRISEIQKAEFRLIRILFIANKSDRDFVELLADALRNEFDITGILGKKDALNRIVSLKPDLVLLNVGGARRIRMKTFLQRLNKGLPTLKTLVLLDRVNRKLIEQVKHIGGHGCVENTQLEEIRKAIHALYNGNTWFNDEER